jgi:hypothetical protein
MKRIAFFIIVTTVIFSCKKDDSGTPAISAVRTVDPTTKDSLFTQAIPGTLIVIQGNNLAGLQAVFLTILLLILILLMLPVPISLSEFLRVLKQLRPIRKCRAQ